MTHTAVSTTRPVPLGPNQPERFYRGGSRIARFRGLAAGSASQPEDWVASATPLLGEAELGLTRLPDGRRLLDAVREDPEGWLGRSHLSRFGPTPALLVKLLDAAQRLPVHAHPDRAFSLRHLDCPFGKTEAWIILEADPGAVVHLGFRRDVDADALAEWVEHQDQDAMLEAMHSVAVGGGDAVLVPAGMPHAIGAGVFLAELQEPTDLSVLMEWTGFGPAARRTGHLGLGYEQALRCVDRRAVAPGRLRHLARGAGGGDDPAAAACTALLGAEADPFFRAHRLRPAAAPTGAVELDAGWCVLVVLAGEGHARTGEDLLPLRGGQTVLVPYGAGRVALTGEVELLCCRPPA